ncbi:MAG TPA: HEAT repeat domain-containing protein [Polyangiaceae bacterium]|nr:HEAT repeat domain-containing protein [Polyangiaceae bacterium]
MQSGGKALRNVWLAMVAITMASPLAFGRATGDRRGYEELLDALEYSHTTPDGNDLILWFRRNRSEAARDILGLLSDQANSLSGEDRNELLALLAEQEEQPLLKQLTPRSKEWSASVVLQALGRFGRSDSLPLALDELARISSRQWRSKRCRETAAESLASILRRDASGFAQLGGRAKRLSEDGITVLAQACAMTGRPEAIAVIKNLLKIPRASELKVLASLESLRIPREGFNGRHADVARGFLDHQDARLRRISLRVLRASGDSEAIEELIEALEDKDRGVQAAAANALRELAGTDVAGADADGWQDWYEGEVEWWADNEFDVQDALLGDRAVSMLRSLRSHVFLRDRLTAALRGALDHDDPGVVALACHMLGEFGLAHAAPDLCESMDTSHEDVRSAAHTALQRVTGQPFSQNRETWWRWMH